VLDSVGYYAVDRHDEFVSAFDISRFGAPSYDMIAIESFIYPDVMVRSSSLRAFISQTGYRQATGYMFRWIISE
jgi:hypothetical protein